MPSESYFIWYENVDGAGRDWAAHEMETDTSYNRASAAWVADVDSDGDMDLVAAAPNYDYSNPASPAPAGGQIAWWEIFK